MENEKTKPSINLQKFSFLILSFLLVSSVVLNLVLIKRMNLKEESMNNLSASLINTVSAKEIYPMFECPCCGKAISECTCPMANERTTFISALAQMNISEKEIIMAYVKKYGLSSFTDKQNQEEFREELIKQAPADRPVIVLSPDIYDFGDVSQKEGRYFTSFDLKNEGKSDLVINRLETSCGCTFASIIFEGKENPYFTMPGHDNPTDWEGVIIPPGANAQLKVMYDPTVHMDFRGTAVREISVFSNDPIDFEKNVTVELNQVD